METGTSTRWTPGRRTSGRRMTARGRARERDASGGTLAEGFRRRDASAAGDVNVIIQHEWDARFARVMPEGPQARWMPSRGSSCDSSLPSMFFRRQGQGQNNNQIIGISKGGWTNIHNMPHRFVVPMSTSRIAPSIGLVFSSPTRPTNTMVKVCCPANSNLTITIIKIAQLLCTV